MIHNTAIFTKINGKEWRKSNKTEVREPRRGKAPEEEEKERKAKKGIRRKQPPQATNKSYLK